MNILLIGLSHKTAPVAIRERLAFPPAMLRSALTHFDRTHSKAHLEDVMEGVILSTCNRLEVYARVINPPVAQEAILKFLGRSGDVSPDQFSDYLYTRHNEEAVHHLMRVAAGVGFYGAGRVANPGANHRGL